MDIRFFPCFPFQSTHLLRGATGQLRNSPKRSMISIHAPLARCDENLKKAGRNMKYFNPRTSCEVRHGMIIENLQRIQFQSTHLLRGATRSAARASDSEPISIHAPLARCDFLNFAVFVCTFLFQSTHLLRGATKICQDPKCRYLISIHAPLARCDPPGAVSGHITGISIHAPLARCDKTPK